uniref:SOCS box domain-containing protein n=1 Tax=Denticeps clupeoides TaxID=299321 RepID=A0AAY4EZN9_9TELE
MDFAECYQDTCSALALAARQGDARQVQRLLKLGYSGDVKDNRGWNALHEAAASGHLSCVEALLHHGANPDLFCNQEQWQLPIHAAAQFGQIRILQRLVDVTCRDCDRAEGKVSPVYLAVLGEKAASLRPLLQAGYSADAQPCPQFGYGCPLELWTGFKICDEQGSCDPEKEIVRSLLAAGAQASERAYVCALRHSEVLPLILDYRGLPGGEDGAKLAKRALLEMWNAAHWLPLLLKAGMDPSLFLNCKMFEETHINVLCFFLEFLNWSTLPAELQTTLTRRLAEMPPSSVPALAHLCRLALRDAAGSDRLAKKSFVQRLPIPSILHDYLQFSSVFRAYRNTFSSPSNS